MTDLTPCCRAECSGNSYEKTEEEKNQTYENSNIMQDNIYRPYGCAKSSHGIVYQLYIIMYYMLWVSKEKKQFNFLSEAHGCGQLDDVILIYKNEDNYTGSFMQVKHRLNSKIPIKYDDLIEFDEKPLSIFKYLFSYKTLEDNKAYDYISNKMSYLLSNNGFKKCQNLQNIITKVDNTVLSETPLHKDNDESFGNIQCFKIKCNVSVIRNIALMKILSNEQVEKFIIDNQNLFHESFLEYFDNEKTFNTLTNQMIKSFLPCLLKIKNYITKFKIQSLPRLFDLFFKYEEVNELFDKFKKSFTFVTFVPDYEVMESLIKKIMGERFKLIDPANITDSFQIKIQNWLNIGKNNDKSTTDGNDSKLYSITEDKLKEWLEDLYILYSKSVVAGMTKQVKSDYIHENLVFEEKHDLGHKVKKFLTGDKHILEVKTDDPELCLNLIWQRVNESHCVPEDDYFVVTRLKNILDDARKDNHILNAFKHPGSPHLLALIVLKGNDDFDKNDIKNACNSIREILKLKNKRIIIILKPDIVLFTNLTNQELSQSISYSFEFSHLNVETRTFILDKHICFQGKQVSLKTIMDKNEADKFINSEILSKILKNQLEIGYSFDYASEKNGKNYIHRTLSRKVKLEYKKLKKLKNDVLLLSNFKEKEGSSFKEKLALNNIHVKSWDSYNKQKDKDKAIRVVTKETAIEQELWTKIVKTFNHVPNIHWLEVIRIYKETAIFHWRDSSPQFDTKKDHSLLKKYLTSETESPGLYEDKDVIEILCKDKLCIISNNPGFGKSTFIRALGEKIKSQHSSSWVFVIKLNQYGNMNKKYNLNNIDSCDDETYLIEHLFKMILHVENSEKQRTFDHQLLSNKIQSKSKRLKDKTPDIFFLFDGFDEISPAYKDNTMRIIKAVRNNPAFSTLVTTRFSTEKDLEKQLQKLSLHLDLLTEEDQKQFIDHELKAKGIENGRLLTNVMEKINQVEKRLKDNSFSRNPLNLSMLVEIFGNEQSRTTTEEINLLTLYKKFVDIKWKKYNDEKCLNVEGNQPQTVKDIIFEDKLNKIHAELALLVLMPDKTDKKKLKELKNFIDLLERRNKNGHEEISRIGIVNYNNCEPRFSHRSFAEYFLSDFLKKYRDNLFYKEIYKEVSTKNEYSVVKEFLNLRSREFMKVVDKNETYVGESEVLNMKKYWRGVPHVGRISFGCMFLCLATILVGMIFFLVYYII